MMKLVLVLLLLALPVLAHADEIGGRVSLRGGRAYISISNDATPWLLTAVSPQVEQDLDKLKNGDLLIGTGTFSIDSRSVSVESIDMVGLRALLGVWRTVDWHLFEFEDFSRLNLYAPTANSIADSHTPTRAFSYSIAPDNGNHWSIFMADSLSVHIGSLELIGRRVHITLLNNDTGQVAEQIDLSPVSVR